MGDPLQAYRDAIATRVHAVCLDRNLDPQSPVATETNCRIDRLLPHLVALANAVGPDDPVTFQAACERTICSQCGHLNERSGTCDVREQAACCLYRYLPLIYDAIQQVGAGRS